jgi:hypothetical protein
LRQRKLLATIANLVAVVVPTIAVIEMVISSHVNLAVDVLKARQRLRQLSRVMSVPSNQFAKSAVLVRSAHSHQIVALRVIAQNVQIVHFAQHPRSGRRRPASPVLAKKALPLLEIVVALRA